MSRPSRRSTLSSALLVGAVTAASFVLSPISPAHAANSMVTVVHGIPGTPVDVYVNGKLTLNDFQPNTVTDPLSLAPGSYDVKVFPATAPDASGTPVIEAKAQVPDGGNVTLVAHLTADGKPTITPFVNDVSPIPAGKGRLIVRHTAAAPAVDVRANGQVIAPNLTNPNEAKLVTAAGTVSADVVLAGTSTVAIGPAQLNVTEGVTTIVYAVGSANQKTLGLIVQKISGMGGHPGGVPGGHAGFASTDVPAWVWSLAGLVLVAALGTSVLLARSTPAARNAG